MNSPATSASRQKPPLKETAPPNSVSYDIGQGFWFRNWGNPVKNEREIPERAGPPGGGYSGIASSVSKRLLSQTTMRSRKRRAPP